MSMVLAGLSLRLVKMPAMWIGDSATDFLVAKHIVKFQDFPLTGPYPSAFPLPISPLWYWYLALFILINDKLPFMISVFALLHSLSIITVYGIGRLLFKGVKVALIAALFFTVSASEIYFSRNLWGNQVIIPFVLASVYFFLKYQKSQNVFELIVSLLFLLFANLITYASLPFILVYAYFIFKKTGNFKKAVLILGFYGMIFILLHFHWIYTVKTLNMTPSHLKKDILPVSLLKNGYFFLQSVFPFNPKTLKLAFIGLVGLITINIKSFLKGFLFIKPLMLPFSVITLTLIGGSLVRSECCYTYYTAVYPFFFLVIAFLLIYDWRLRNIFLKSISLFFIIFFTVLFTTDYKRMYDRHNQYLIYGEVTGRILEDTRRSGKKLSDFNAVFINDQVYVDSSIFWYFLEEKTAGKFAKVSNNRLNLEINFWPQYLYVVCSDLELLICQKIMMDDFPEYRLSKKIPNFDKYIITLYSKDNI